MTITIVDSGAQLDLPADAKLNIETASPIFSNASSMSLPISLPLTPNNRRALNFPDMLNMYDSGTQAIRVIPDIQVVVRCGVWQQKATMNISSCSETAVEVTLYFLESNIWSKIEDMTLPQALAGLHYGNIPPANANLNTSRQNLFNSLSEDFRTYPTSVDKREDDHYQGEISYEEWEQLLEERATWFQTRDFVMAPIHTADGWLNDISMPRSLKSTTGYKYITAFLRLDFVLHKIFEKAGYLLTIDLDSYPDDEEYGSFFAYQWHSIIVLNNTMDALYPGCMYYSTLVPDISVKEFLLAVSAQFGCAFFLQPDGSYKMRFTQKTLARTTGSAVTQFSGLQTEFNVSPDYVPVDNLEKLTRAKIIYEKLPQTYYDSHYDSGHNGLDFYPKIHAISMEGVSQRTTMSTINGEDSTKDTKCPLIFACMDFAIIYDTEYDQMERPHTSTDSYPAIRKPYIEIFDYEQNQGHPEDISRDLNAWYFVDIDGLFQIVNNAYNTILNCCDKITITRMLKTNEVSSYDFSQPYIIKNRLCWPSKIHYELVESGIQQVTIELIAPRKIVG